MNLGGPGFLEHGHELLAGVAAHDAIVDDDKALAGNDAGQRIELDANGILAHSLGGLNERPAHVAVLHDAIGVRDAAFGSISAGSGKA